MLDPRGIVLGALRPLYQLRTLLYISHPTPPTLRAALASRWFRFGIKFWVMAVLTLPAVLLIIWLLPQGDSFLQYCINLMNFALNWQVSARLIPKPGWDGAIYTERYLSIYIEITGLHPGA